MEKDLGTAKKSNHMLSKEIKRMKMNSQSRICSERLIKNWEDEEKANLCITGRFTEDKVGVNEVKHNQTCATLEKSQIQSQLKTARIRLREAAETATHKEIDWLNAQEIDNDTEIVPTKD